VLAGWNGLAIAALAEAGAALDEPRYISAATAALEFIHARLRLDDGRLARAWRGGKLGPSAFAEDLALLGLGCLAAYEATFEPAHYENAMRHAEALVAGFRDPAGGFFLASNGGEGSAPIKDDEDSVLPSSNAAAAELMTRLYLLTGESRWDAEAALALQFLEPRMRDSPESCTAALAALDLRLRPGPQIAISGDSSSPEVRALAHVVHDRYLPGAVVAAGTGDWPELLHERVPVGGRAAAYVCRGFTCELPVCEPRELAALLARGQTALAPDRR
jgi:uncharacterized protein YyaL (SSP411 family)